MAVPYLEIATTVLGALKGGTKVSQAGAQSGAGVFVPDNVFKRNKSMIDFGEPMQVALLAVAGVVVIYVFKKVI